MILSDPIKRKLLITSISVSFLRKISLVEIRKLGRISITRLDRFILCMTIINYLSVLKTRPRIRLRIASGDWLLSIILIRWPSRLIWLLNRLTRWVGGFCWLKRLMMLFWLLKGRWRKRRLRLRSRSLMILNKSLSWWRGWKWKSNKDKSYVRSKCKKRGWYKWNKEELTTSRKESRLVLMTSTWPSTGKTRRWRECKLRKMPSSGSRRRGFSAWRRIRFTRTLKKSNVRLRRKESKNTYAHMKNKSRKVRDLKRNSKGRGWRIGTLRKKLLRPWRERSKTGSRLRLFRSILSEISLVNKVVMLLVAQIL